MAREVSGGGMTFIANCLVDAGRETMQFLDSYLLSELITCPTVGKDNGKRKRWLIRRLFVIVFQVSSCLKSGIFHTANSGLTF